MLYSYYSVLIYVIVSYSSASHTQLFAISATRKKSKTQVRSCKHDYDLHLKCLLRKQITSRLLSQTLVDGNQWPLWLAGCSQDQVAQPYPLTGIIVI